jgi:molybdopterin molybdotransferase
MEEKEIDEGIGYTGFEEALTLVYANTGPVATDKLPIISCPGYVSAENVHALVDSPPYNASLKDGFAVKSQDINDASPRHPIELILVGSVFAGGSFEGHLLSGQTVKVCTGAPIPVEADAVVSAELCDENDKNIRFSTGVNKGKNIIPAGEDVKVGQTAVKKGQVILPARLAFIAAAGITHLKVYRKPHFAIISIGDELVMPGHKLKEGQIYASNSVNIGAWLSLFNIPFKIFTVADDTERIKRELVNLSPETDAIITNGGVMHSEKDLIIGILDDLGWDMKFRHVRMGPGKATSFGIWQNKPVYCFSGGPTSNGIASLQLALPGIFNMIGFIGSPLLTTTARLTRDVKGRNKSWTEFKEARLVREADGQLSVTPSSERSRLKSMADAECLLCKPEGVESLYRDQIVTVQLLTPTLTGNFNISPYLKVDKTGANLVIRNSESSGIVQTKRE